MKRRGSFCCFTLGRRGGSEGFVRYITRPEAVRDGQGGFCLYQLPPEVARAQQ